MAKEIGTDEICEIASIITEEICIAKGIQIDQNKIMKILITQMKHKIFLINILIY